MSSSASSFTKDDASNNNKVNNARNNDKKKRKRNALEVLMQQSTTPSASKAKSKCISSIRSSKSSSKKQAKKASSHLDFVICPAGCGRHLVNLDHYINQHLDQACPSLLPQNNNNNQLLAKLKSTTVTSMTDNQDDSIQHNANTAHPSTTVEPVSIEVTSSSQPEHDQESIIEVLEDATSAVNHGKTRTRNPESNDSTKTTLQQHEPAGNRSNHGSDTNSINEIASPISSATPGDQDPDLQIGGDDDPSYQCNSVNHDIPVNDETKPQPAASNVTAVLSPPSHDSAKTNGDSCNSITEFGDKSPTLKTSPSSMDVTTNSDNNYNNNQSNDASSNYYYAEEIQQDLQMLKDHSATRSSLNGMNQNNENDCADDPSDPPIQTTTEDSHQTIKPVGECTQTTTEDAHQTLKPVGECNPNTTLMNNIINHATAETVSCQQAEKNQQKCSDNQKHRSVVSPEQPSLPVERSIAHTAKRTNYNNPYQSTASNGKSRNKSKDNESVDKTKNVFAHMMKQSSKVFSSADAATNIEQQFTLTYNANADALSWTLQGRNAPADWEPPLWSTTVQVKDKQQDPPAIIQLTLHFRLHQPTTSNNFTTTIPQQSHRWVQLPSRLSVPVLKSMLQKSVRRRRPLPAVRVAMELMDKSLGELLRRVPIIILEDSSLHPHLTPLVWMMMAHSKGFFNVDTEQPSPQRVILPDLKLQVLRIIYQIASCPYQDHLVPTNNEDPNVQEADSANTVNKPCLSDHFPEPKQQTAEISDDKSAGKPTLPSGKREELQMLIWAMLIRAQYGGMACDVNMLKRYANVWHQRLNGADAAPPPAPHKCWFQLIHDIHSTGKDQALTRLPSTTVQLEKLSVTDVCKEGIDFHCSDLVDNLLKDPQVPTACHEVDPQSTPDQLLKRCIWKFSAGVNLRRPLFVKGDGTGDEPKQQDAALKYLWRDIVAPKVTAYQTNYLKTRLR